MKNDHVILGIHVTDRVRYAGEVQKVLTEYGHNIKTRLGLHELSGEAANGQGLVLLELVGDSDVRRDMVAKLKAIDGLQVQEMVFTH